jgi:hypothetical protein
VTIASKDATVTIVGMKLHGWYQVAAESAKSVIAMDSNSWEGEEKNKSPHAKGLVLGEGSIGGKNFGLEPDASRGE